MVKIKEKLVKLLAVAFVGTMPILGVSNIACAMEPHLNLEGGDGEEASETMQRRAEEERRIAQLEFELGEANISSLTNEAIVWLERAAEHGHAQAQFCLGEHYRFGGMASKALKWYQLAADQGHNGAQRMLAMYYENGEIFPLGK